MSFGENLNILTDIFEMNNNRLAKALNVDPSLISKWKNGKRSIKADSVLADEIVSYFSKQKASNFQMEKLLQLVLSSDKNLSIKDRNELKEYLSEWLFSDNSLNDTFQLEMKSNQGVNKIINCIMSIPDFISKASLLKPNDPAEPKIWEESGIPTSYEIFAGNEGRRKAVMNFFHEALSFNEPLELFCTSQEDMSWLTEDKQYQSLWTNTLIQVLQKGHRFVMIHNLDRNLVDLVDVLRSWIPISVTGRLESFYYPRYQSRNFNMSLLIMKNRVALISMSPEGQSENNFLLFRDPFVVKMYEQIYHSLLADCQPLLKVYNIRRFEQLQEDILTKLFGPGYLYLYNEGLNTVSMPENLFRRLITHTGFKRDEAEHRLAVFQSLKKMFLSNIQQYSCREIYSSSILDLILKNKTWKYSSMEFFGHSCELNQEEIRELFSHMVQTLERYPQYEIAFLDDHPANEQTRLQLGLKEGSFITVGAYDIDGNNSVLVSTGENSIIHSFEDYFNEIWEGIPQKNKTKKSVILRINEFLSQL